MDAVTAWMPPAVGLVATKPLTTGVHAAGPLAAIPSPAQSVWHVLGVPIRAYALCIVAAIIVAAIVTEIRMRHRGAPPNLVLDIVVWAVPFGILGARIYHVLTSPSQYFGSDGDLTDIFRIWNGGIGIWGAVLGGAVGAAIACRQIGVPLRFVAGAIAPALPLAQAVGRWGNYFNNELFGGRTDLPWGLRVYVWDLAAGRAKTADGEPIVAGVFHPTFLYESLWDLGVALLVWLLDRRYRFGRGRAFAVYVMAYCAGRFWIEAMRTDPAAHLLGLRLNSWTALVVFIGALIYFVRVSGPQERLIVGADGSITVVDAADAADSTTSGAAAPGGPSCASATEPPTDLSGQNDDSDGQSRGPGGTDAAQGGGFGAATAAGTGSWPRQTE